MVRIISVKCPECGAALQFEEGRQTAFCSYCGAKILLHNENEFIHRTIDEAEIKQAETERLIIQKEYEIEEREARNHRSLVILWLVITLVLLTVGILFCVSSFENSGMLGAALIFIAVYVALLGGIYLFSPGRKRKIRRPGYLPLPENILDYEKLNYNGIAESLRAAGFRNIKTINLGDLRLGLMKKNGSVESIMIDGEAADWDETYHPNSMIVISYHGFRN